MDSIRRLGIDPSEPTRDLLSAQARRELQLQINLKLVSSGQPPCDTGDTAPFIASARDLLQSYREKNRLLSNHQCPADRRIQNFIDRYLADGDRPAPRLPVQTLILDRHGLARELSLPIDGDHFQSDIIDSYRVAQGVLHNPASDRRTTAGSFHIAEGGLPIPGDKLSVPKAVFGRLLEAALNPPESLLRLPFSAHQSDPAQIFVSLLLRPPICPEIPGFQPEQRMEIRFFAPGNLVANLDFVESIFGNGGNPFLPEHDAALDVEHWSGHSGCVILAPHLTQLSKRELGLPHWDAASEQQRVQGLCWRDPEERYNAGQAFKLTARDASGVILTLIADNYFGYCKKEVKTQIGFAANLHGLAQEEHAGGALAFPRINHGEEYGTGRASQTPGYNFDDLLARCGEWMLRQPEGHAIDKRFPDLVYVPQDARMEIATQRIQWGHDGATRSIRLQPGKIYMKPDGYRIEMQKHPGAPSWRLIGTLPIVTFCHKPCTVSGGGKSEISKSLDDAVLYGPLFIDELEQDLDLVQQIFERDYRGRFRPGFEHEDPDPTRPPLSPQRSLGSVIKLLTPSPSHTPDYEAWLQTIPPRILALAFMIKRLYRPEWGDHWRAHLSVDEVDGAPAHELKAFGRRVVASYLRVGFDTEHKWRTFKLRQDFIACEKVQMEDDITASVVVPQTLLGQADGTPSDTHSLKLTKNCEYRLFQRPDDAIIPGYDKQAERELAQSGNFFANYEPLTGSALQTIVEDALTLDRFTPPMRDRLLAAAEAPDGEAPHGYVVSSAHPRLVDGKPSKNPRYLQLRPDIANPLGKYAAEMGIRLNRKLAPSTPLILPVDAVLTGRRNNPPEPGIRPLAVYNPIHYQELPELFMDFVCSLTGKSPSTTGAGSEGALTKAPFNALRPTADLNNALVDFILTGHAGFSSSAGHIGPNLEVAHDISLLVPEIWSRLRPEERDPAFLIEQGYLEPLEDFEHQGRPVLASRLGYRITERFVAHFMGKIFDNPRAVFTEAMLRPETQDLDVFVDGVHNICEAQQRVAQRYLEDGSIEDACPPLQSLLRIMAEGSDHGRTIRDPEIRRQFTREALLASDWYQERLVVKQQRDIALAERQRRDLQDFVAQPENADLIASMALPERLAKVESRLARLRRPDYPQALIGTLGADPLAPPQRDTR